MKNELLTIGPFTVYGYGLMIAIGIVAGCLTAEYRAGKQKLDSEQIFPMILWCLVGGFFCAKFLFWITEWKSIVQDPGFIMETLSSGFVVFGGIIGGILTGLLYCRIRKLVFFKYADVILPSVALAQGFGRIGCFLAGCCYGKETESIFSVIFQNSEYAPNHVALIPTQLYSSGLDFLHFLLLMLIAKLNGKPYTTEFPMPSFDRVAPNPAVKDMAHATVALCTSGGIVPHGNPDRIESSSASKYGEYDIEGVMDLKEGEWETAHGGYDPVYANEDSDRVLPVDVLRDMEKEGRIGKLYRYFYSTTGNGTAVLSSKKFAAEYAAKMKADGVDCVIMTST